jgi:hypothetical protein
VDGLVSSVWWLVLAGQRPAAPVLGLAHHLGVLFLLARLVVTAVEVSLALGVWWGRRTARTVQMVWSGLVVGAPVVTSITHATDGSRAGATGVLTIVASAAVLVLLWLPASRPWFRPASVRPGL